MPKPTYQQLTDALVQEKKALKRGVFEDLDAISATKVLLFERLAQENPTASEMTAIREKLAENQSLLVAAIAGVQAARDRSSALEHVRDGLNVYDQSGKMALVPTRNSDFEKKA